MRSNSYHPVPNCIQVDRSTKLVDGSTNLVNNGWLITIQHATSPANLNICFYLRLIGLLRW